MPHIFFAARPCRTRVQSCNGFAHSNGDVRDAAREMTVALHALVGEEVGHCVHSCNPKLIMSAIRVIAVFGQGALETTAVVECDGNVSHCDQVMRTVAIAFNSQHGDIN